MNLKKVAVFAAGAALTLTGQIAARNEDSARFNRNANVRLPHTQFSAVLDFGNIIVSTDTAEVTTSINRMVAQIRHIEWRNYYIPRIKIVIDTLAYENKFTNDPILKAEINALLETLQELYFYMLGLGDGISDDLIIETALKNLYETAKSLKLDKEPEDISPADLVILSGIVGISLAIFGWGSEKKKNDQES